MNKRSNRTLRFVPALFALIGSGALGLSALRLRRAYR